MTVSATLCHIPSCPGLHGVTAEPPGCCSMSHMAASLHHPLSADQEAASAGVKVPSLDQACNGERRGCEAMCRCATSKQVHCGTLMAISLAIIFCVFLTMSLLPSCVSEAWALLKRGHTESDEVVLYFLQACNGLGLCAEALQCIPAGYNVGEYQFIQQMHQRYLALK